MKGRSRKVQRTIRASTKTPSWLPPPWMIEKIKEERRRRERERIGDRPIIEIPKPPPEKDPQKKEEPEQGS